MNHLPDFQQEGFMRFTEENYTAIFKAYWKTLYAIAYRRLYDEELAKDMVQEVFVYCWKQRGAIQIKDSVEAYLRGAMQYQLIAHFRKEKIQSKAFARIYERMVQVETQMRDLLTEQDLSRTLDTELDQMPETMREIFKLRIRDYSVNEIAGRLNLAEKTVRNNLSRGLHRIRKAIAKDFPKDFIAIYMLLYSILH